MQYMRLNVPLCKGCVDLHEICHLNTSMMQAACGHVATCTVHYENACMQEKHVMIQLYHIVHCGHSYPACVDMCSVFQLCSSFHVQVLMCTCHMNNVMFACFSVHSR